MVITSKKEEKNEIIIFKFVSLLGKFNLSTSSGEIVDQIKEVKGHQKKGKEEEQTKDH